MKLDHQFSSDILQYACCQNFRNIALNILCKYFDRKETFDTLPTDCKQRLYGQTLLWIVKGSKFALFKEGLTLLRLLQAAHPNLCREKDWEKLELGIKLKIILQQMLSGCSTSQCLETFHRFFPEINEISSEDETQTDRSLPFLLCQLIKQPSERNSISNDSNFQTEVGAKLIHTITHRVKHLIKNLKWKLPTPRFSKVVKSTISEEKRKIYHLLEEGSLNSKQLLVFLQLRADIDEDKMFQTVQRLLDGRGREVEARSVCNQSEKLLRSLSEEEEEEEEEGEEEEGEEEEEDHQLQVIQKTSGNRTKRKERETAVTCERSAIKYDEVTDGIPTCAPSLEDVKVESGSTRRERNRFVSPTMHLESSYVNPDSETDLIKSCMDSKLVVVLKKLNLPVRHATEVGRNDTECPLLCSVRSSGSPSDKSLVLLGDSSPILLGERSPPLWSDESSILSSDRSPPFPNETHCVANEGVGSFDSPKSSWDNTNNLERKGRMKGEIAQYGSKVRRVSECSSDSVEYFCNSRLNSIQEPKLTVSKENINFAKDMPFNRRVSLEEESSFRDRKDRSINAVSDSQIERQICRDIRNVTQNPSEEKEESVSSSGSKCDSKNYRRGSKEPFVVRSFYSQSLENYKWRSDHRSNKRKHSVKSSNVHRLSRSNYHSLATDDGLGAGVQQIRNKMSRNGAYTLPCGNWQRSNASSKKERVDSNSKETFWSCSLDNPPANLISGLGELTNSPVFEYRYSSSGSSSNQSLSLLTGRRVLFSNAQDGSNEVHTREKEPDYSEERSPILWSSSSCDNSNNAIKSDFSSDELRFVAESQSKEIADAGQRGLVATTPTSRKSLVRTRSDMISSSSSEFQNAQRSHTSDESYGTEETVPDSDEEEGGEHSGRQSFCHHRFPSLVQYLNIHESRSALRPCSVVLEKLKLEEMRLRILLSQET